MSKNKKTMKQLLLMIFLTVLIQGVMLTKSAIIAANLGVGIEMDAFNFSNSMTSFIFGFIGTGITTVLIPNLLKKGKSKAINTFITSIYLIALIIVGIVFIIRRPLITIISGRDLMFIDLACNIMVISLITQFITSLLGVTNAVFQCNDKFNIPKFGTLSVNILLVLMLAFTKELTINKYTFYLFIIAIINFLIQQFFIRKLDFNYKFSLDFKDKDFKKMIKVFLPTVMSTGLYQVTLITDTIISSRLGEGQISVLNYTNNVVAMINMLLLANLTTYLYPRLAKRVKQEDTQEQLFDYLTFLNSIMCLVVIGFIVVGKSGISLLYERGKFDSEVTTLVFSCAVIYILSLPTNAMRDLIYKYFYANNDTLTPFKNSVVISVLNIAISIILSLKFGLIGIVLGTVIASYVSLTTILIRFKKTFNISVNVKLYLKENIKILSVATAIAILTYYLSNTFIIENKFLNIVIYGSFVIGAYIGILYKLKARVFKIKL